MCVVYMYRILQCKYKYQYMYMYISANDIACMYYTTLCTLTAGIGLIFLLRPAFLLEGTGLVIVATGAELDLEVATLSFVCLETSSMKLSFRACEIHIRHALKRPSNCVCVCVCVSKCVFVCV